MNLHREIQFRPVSYADTALLYAWRQDKSNIENMPSALEDWSKGFNFEEHARHMRLTCGLADRYMIDYTPLTAEVKHGDSNTPDLLGKTLHRPIGTMHITGDGIDKREKGEVGIFIGERGLWGKGIATFALQWLTAGHHGLHAYIETSNYASAHVFSSAGFQATNKTGRHRQFRWELP